MTEFSEKAKWVYGLFDKIKGHMSTDDYSVILFLLYLKAQNLIDDNTDTIKDIRIHSQLDKQNLDKLLAVAEVIDRKLSNISKHSLSIIYNEIRTLDSDALNFGTQSSFSIGPNETRTLRYDRITTGFEEIFELVLYRIASSLGRISGEFIQPPQLTELINSYVGSTEGLRVYNPFAGFASFINGNIKSSSILAQEININSWAIGQLRLLISRTNADFRCEDSIHFWPANEKFDLIVSNPPFGARLNTDLKKLYPDYRIMEEFLLGKSIDSLSDKGKAVVVLSVSTLFKEGTMQKLRQRLIQEDLIESIISFSGGLLFHTSISFIVLVITKHKIQPGKIKLVDARNYITSITSKDKEIDVENLLREVRKNENSEAVRIISNDDVIQNDYNLSILRYFQKEIDGVKLKDLLSNIRGSKSDLPENGKFIRIRDLKDDNIDFELNAADIEESPLNRSDLHKIDCSCLLLATSWRNLKPTYFHFDAYPVFKGADILAFHVDESAVDVDYLINELQSDYVQAQLDSYRMGTTIPYIRRDDLLEIKIHLPSIDEQRAKVDGLQEISEKIRQLQSERNALAHGVSIKEFNEFASLKHTLGTPCQNILGWSKNLSKFFEREKNSISTLNEQFKELFDLGIIEAIAEINRDIKFISEVLEKGEKGLLLNDYEKEIVPLSEINSIFKTISSNEFRFSIQKQLLKVEEMKTRGVNINKVLFKVLIDNLLTNANKYGFKDENKGNHVMIELSEIDSHLIVDIRNNGLPFPQNFNREKFITKYSTADTTNGSGLGGYDINRIASYFDNEEWELILNSDPIYPVIFRFSFPIKFLN